MVKHRTFMSSCRRSAAVIMYRIARRCLDRNWLTPASVILEGAHALAPESFAITIYLAKIRIDLWFSQGAADLVNALASTPDGTPARLAARVGYLFFRLGNCDRALACAYGGARTSIAVRELLVLISEKFGVPAADELVDFCLMQAQSFTQEKRRRDALVSASLVLANAGSTKAAEIYLQILELDPQCVFACHGLVESIPVRDVNHPLVEKMKALAAQPDLPYEKRKDLHFALADVFDRSGNFESAFAHYSLANHIRFATSPPVDLSDLTAAADDRCNVFTKELIERLSVFGCQDDSLVCIVGMPRSGTTLVHQILGQCPGAFSAGERMDFASFASRMPFFLKSKKPYPQCCSEMTEIIVKRLSEEARASLIGPHPQARKVLTKLPDDYLELGLIKILFPKARIIHCRRNAQDTLLSCYFSNFTFIPYSCDLNQLAVVQHRYAKMIRHWADVLPHDTLYEVNYEDLVSDPATEARSLCDFAELPFVDECLKFHERGKPIATVSRYQVRQPIYQSSVNRAKRYENFIGTIAALASPSWRQSSTERQPIRVKDEHGQPQREPQPIS